MDHDPIHIDGSQGEGGGQILRTSLALSAITGRGVRFSKIRAGRAKPGLLRQHLTAARAAAEVCSGVLEGAELRSDALRLGPGEIRGGHYHFAVGTAGSACLVCQTVLPMLLRATERSEVVLEGGTHAMSAPSFDFFATVFLPLLRRMGAKVDVELTRHGFYPAGGGRFVMHVEPTPLAPLSLLDAGPLRVHAVEALVANLPFHIARREVQQVAAAFGLPEDRCHARNVDSPGPGNVLAIELTSVPTGDGNEPREPLQERVTAFGRKNLRAEGVAKQAVQEARALVEARVSVGAHLADQLLLPMALAGGGAFRTLPLSLHSQTNIRVIKRFLDVSVQADVDPASGQTLVRVTG